ncbi:hypothetical protein H0H93_003755, partial [Arthromyces matolae]
SLANLAASRRLLLTIRISIMGCIPSKQQVAAADADSDNAQDQSQKRPAKQFSMGTTNPDKSQLPSPEASEANAPWHNGHRRMLIEENGTVKVTS